MTVLYDPLNQIPISARLHKGREHDLKASNCHIEELLAGDIVLADRAYCSYLFFAEILSKNADFVIRCRCNTFERYHNLFTTKQNELVAEVEAPKKIKATVPESLKIRFIRIPLGNGEVEVLATSLLDKEKFNYRAFRKLYYRRWKVETFFQTLKSRLCIDNFTGKTVESIYQDVYATLFVSGLESMITADANEELGRKNTVYKQRVNKAVSFHAIKHQIVEMINDPQPDFQDRVKVLFLRNPTLVRPDRPKRPRRYIIRGADRRSLYFQRYAKKHVF